jgi:anaerobic magnesium-protoporphyrin IX monomethyl ester cyclase
MKVLLVQPSEFSDDIITPQYKKYGTLKVVKKPTKIRPMCLPPLGLLYVASAIKRNNHDVSILDAHTLQLTNKEIVQEIVSFKPDIVGISLFTIFLRDAYLLTKSLRNALNVPIVVGGPHVSAMPEKTLEEFKDVDFLMLGWADFSIVDFLNMLSGKVDKESVPGLCYRANNAIIKNQEAALPSNLDDIPMPDRSIIDNMYNASLYYNITISNRKIDVLLTSRNCPFNCKFCQNLTGHKYLPHSPERVIEEIDYIASKGRTSIEIMDDTFTVNRKRVEKIFDLIESKNYNLDFRIRSRVNLVDKDLLKRFKHIGGRAVSYGMESGSDAVLKLMSKGTTVASNKAACLATKGVGLLCQSTWIIGWPGESLKDLEETFRFIRKYLPNTFNICFLIPLPDTTIYEEAKKNGTLDKDWSVHNTSWPFIRTEQWPEFPPLVRFLIRKTLFAQINPRYLLQTASFIIRSRNFGLSLYGLKLIRWYIRYLFSALTKTLRERMKTAGR